MLKYPNDKEAGVDEVGRGCLAFDVCASAVVFPPEVDVTEEDWYYLSQIKDSKKLRPAKRDELATFIKNFAVSYGIGVATPKEIDEHNILNATYIAMHRAIDSIDNFSHLRVDGSKFEPYLRKGADGWVTHECVIGGDNKDLHIAAASILAKSYRDHVVIDHCTKNEQLESRYGFMSNKAYGTKKHIEGLKTFGPTEHHRKTFISKYS